MIDNNANIQNLMLIQGRIGHDSFSKLMLIATQNYPEWAKGGKKSGEPLNRTLSYCIEATYNILTKSRPDLLIYDALPPPKTVKAQELYDIYQHITSLKAEGASTTKILAYLNQEGFPTPDDIWNSRPLTAINRKPSRWDKRDLNVLVTDDGQPSELLREYLKEFNKRSQRKRTPGTSSCR